MSDDSQPTPSALTREDIPAKCMSICEQLLNLDGRIVSESALLQMDLGADSLDLVELTMILEEDFAIEIADADAVEIADAAKAVTITDIVDLVQRHITPQAAM